MNRKDIQISRKELRAATDYIEDLFADADGGQDHRDGCKKEAARVLIIIQDKGGTLTPAQKRKFKADYVAFTTPLRGSHNLRVYWHVDGAKKVVGWRIEQGVGRRNKIQNYMVDVP